MGRWTYYSPALLGTGLAVIMFVTYREFLPVWPAWLYWLVVVGGCLAAGLGCQLVMVAAQGAFAQVLPVPWGRSIRGGGARLAGWLLLLGVTLCFAGGLLGLEDVGLAAGVVGGLGLAALAAALVVYIWCWPLALRDFTDER